MFALRVYVSVCTRVYTPERVKELERVRSRRMAQSGEWQAFACKAGENIDVQAYEVSTLLWLDYGTQEGSKSEDDLQGAVRTGLTMRVHVNYAQSTYTHIRAHAQPLGGNTHTQPFRSLSLARLSSNSCLRTYKHTGAVCECIQRVSYQAAGDEGAPIRHPAAEELFNDDSVLHAPGQV